MKIALRRLPLLMVVLVVSACFPGWPPDDQPDRIGIELSSDGSRVVVLYPDCSPDLRVRYIELRPWGESAVWRISSEVGSRQREFVVGAVPEGFEEEIPLSGRLSNQDHLLIVDNTLRTGETVSFEPGELKRGKVLFGDGEHLSRQDYLSRAEC